MPLPLPLPLPLRPLPPLPLLRDDLSSASLELPGVTDDMLVDMALSTSPPEAAAEAAEAEAAAALPARLMEVLLSRSMAAAFSSLYSFISCR